MKKRNLLNLGIALVLILCLVSQAAALAPTTLKGSGTEEDPWQISNEAELITAYHQMFDEWSGASFCLTQDITLTKPLDNGAIGSSMVIVTGGSQPQNYGVFDGAGHTIYNFSVNSTSNEGRCFGMFENNGGEIRDLHLVLAENYTHTGRDPVWGGITDYNSGQVIGCSVRGNVTIDTEQMFPTSVPAGFGLVVGINWGDVTDCQANGTVHGPAEYTGDVIGLNQGNASGNTVQSIQPEKEDSTSDRPSGVRSCPSGADCPSRGFTDVPDTAWYHEAMDIMLSYGVMSGVGNGRLAPDGILSRAQLLQLFYNSEEKPAVSPKSEFLDVRPNAWYYDAVHWGVSKGYVNGYGNGRFAPDDPVTREQLAVILARIAGVDQMKSEPLKFKDASLIRPYALNAVGFCVETGLTSGYPDNTFRPQQATTRAQMATILAKVLEN